jgi:hypothetical protein
MNRTLSIVLCSSVVCTSLFSADAPIPNSSSSTTTTTDPLAVPPVKPWVQKAREQQEQNVRKPDMLNLLLQRVTGSEEEGKRFHDDPSHRHMIEERVEKLIINLNHGSAQETEKFLMMCEQKGLEISHDASAELFKAAYANRVERENNYVRSIENSKQLMITWRANQIKQIRETLEYSQKAAETQNNTYVTSLIQHKNGHEVHTKIYTHIMQLAQKLNPQFAPTYATNPALYYDDLEKQFGLKIKMEEQAALATHVREVSKLLAALKQFGNIDMEQVWFDGFMQYWSSQAGNKQLIHAARTAYAGMMAQRSFPTTQEPVEPSQATGSSESESAVDKAKRRIEEKRVREAKKAEDTEQVQPSFNAEVHAQVMANPVQPIPTSWQNVEQKQ